MGDKSGIEWTDATWNPVVGCTRVSAGCDNCYAVRQTRRLAGSLPLYQGLVNPGKGHFNGTVRTAPERLDQPLRWKRPRRIFVNSMSDLFHPGVPDDFIDRVFASMALADHHVFQVLTKRPERMAGYLSKPDTYAHVDAAAREMDPKRQPQPIQGNLPAAGWPLPNVWLGTSVEDQATANERIPHLLQTPAAVRFLSCEPLLGPVDLELTHEDRHAPGTLNALTGSWWPAVGGWAEENRNRQDGGPAIDWVIVGGESGPGARPMHPEWARSIRDQCVHAGVAFHFKQWGAWAPLEGSGAGAPTEVGFWTDDPGYLTPRERDRIVRLTPDARLVSGITSSGATHMVRVGKKEAGRELDGRTWDEWPGAQVVAL